MIKSSAFVKLSLLASLVAGLVASATAADFPTKPITLLTPFAAGGTSDIVARIVGHRLGQVLGQSVIVDNRGGAGGTIGAGVLARAAPDGYTLMVTHQGLAFNVSLYDKLPYDTVKDIMPLANIGMTPNVLVVTKALPVKTMQDFLSYAKTKPVNYGSGGYGSAGHLPMEVLQSMTGQNLQHVPYKGSGPALNDLVGGQIQAMLLTIPSVMPHIQAGRVKAIATSGSERSPALPDIPTIDEAGIKGFDYSPWYGFFAPASTPPDVVLKLHTAINKVLTEPEIIGKLGQAGLVVKTYSREEFSQIVTRDIAKWSGIIKKLGVKVN
jgi:tripartite-type tricarboxylate transporter receptor subunit TctC